jgi:ferredoxin-NADP reductase
MRYRNIWMEARVTATKQVASNVLQIDIQPDDGALPFTAGAHIDVSVLINDLPEIRSYSLVGVYEASQAYRIAVKRLASSRGGSQYMWSLTAGSRLRISQPMNHFELTYTRPAYWLVAGGIGITPLVGMAKELSGRGADIQMLYVGSSRREMPFIDLLESYIGNKLFVHASDEKPRFDFEKWIAEMRKDPQVYLCGPLSMMNTIRRFWEIQGKPSADLRFETFGASGQFSPQAFKVSVPRLGLELQVNENQSLLDVLENAGADVMYDCRKGECGLCAVDILSCSGLVDHRDFFFSEKQKGENHKMCACVSRIANGDVVIDTAYRKRKTI